MLASEPPRASANSGEHRFVTANPFCGGLPACAPRKQNALAPVTGTRLT